MPDTNLLIHIRARNSAQYAYPVEAALEDGSFYEGEGQFQLDSRKLLETELSSVTYGSYLAAALFKDHIDEAYQQARALAGTEGQVRLRLWIDSGAAELYGIHWERLVLPHKPEPVPLAADAQTPFSRYLSLQTAEPRPLTARPIRLLVAVANPSNLPDYHLAPIAVDQELTNIAQALRLRQTERTFQVSILPGRTVLPPELVTKLEQAGYELLSGPTTLNNLMRYLDGSHILHFIGHGFFKRQPDAPGGGHAALYLENLQGQTQVVKDGEFISRLTALQCLPQFIFLCACDSAVSAVELDQPDSPQPELPVVQPFVGLGPKLVQVGVSAVVAMQGSIEMESARQLTENFYQFLHQDEAGVVDKALNRARAFLRPGQQDLPVLFMRLQSGQLLAADPVRTTIEAIHRHHEAFFSPTQGQYLPLPIEIIHLTMEQIGALNPNRLPPASARQDLLKTTIELFERLSSPTIDQKTRQPQLLVLVGGYGSNRTTQLQRIAWETACSSLRRDAPRPILPIYIDNRGYSAIRRASGSRFERLILEELQRFWPDLTAAGLASLLASELKVRIFFDGSERLPERERYTAWKEIKALMQTYPHQEYMIATDQASLLSPRFNKVGVDLHLLIIQPLEERKVWRFLRCRTNPNNLNDYHYKLLYHLDHAQLYDLAATPWFLVKMIQRAAEEDYPESRTKVLQQLIEDAIMTIPPGQGMRAHTERFINALAWEMQSAGQLTYPVAQAFELMTVIRGKRDYNLEAFFEWLIKSGLLARVGDEALRFTYSHFQAYCCAKAIMAKPDRGQILDNITATLGRLTRLRRWEETLVLLSGLMAEDIEALKQLLWSIIYGVNLLEGDQAFLAARCLLESHEYLEHKNSTQTIHFSTQVISALVYRLSQQNEYSVTQRIRAIQLLGQLGDTVSVQHLVKIANKKSRIDACGRLDYHFSNLRMAAATALHHLILRQDQTTPDQKVLQVTHDRILSKLLCLWWHEDVVTLAKLLKSRNPANKAMAALILADLQVQFENMNETREQSAQIITCLTEAFLSLELDTNTLWAVTQALSVLDSSMVNQKVILPFIEADTKGELCFNSLKQQLQWYKCLVYLIGQIRSQEISARHFLVERCLKQCTDVRLWATTIDALGWLADQTYKDLLEEIAIGKFEQFGSEINSTKKDRATLYLQHRAIEALINIGNEVTLDKLRQNSIHWDTELWLAFYRTSEEINWRLSQGESI